MSFMIDSPIESFDMSAEIEFMCNELLSITSTANLSNYFQLNSFAALQNPTLYQQIAALLNPAIPTPTTSTRFTLSFTKFLVKAFQLWSATIQPALPPAVADKFIPHPFIHYLYQALTHLFTVESQVLETRLVAIHNAIQQQSAPQASPVDQSMSDSTNPTPSSDVSPSLSTFILPYGNTNITSLLTTPDVTSPDQHLTYISKLNSLRQSLTLSTFASVCSKLIISSKNLLDASEDCAITDNPQLVDTIFHEPREAPDGDIFCVSLTSMLANFPLTTTTTAAATANKEQPKYHPLDPVPQLTTNLFTPHTMAKFPFIIFNTLLTSNRPQQPQSVQQWRKAYVSTFTNFQRFNLFYECLEGYSKVLSSIQTAMLGVIASFQSIYLTLSHHVKTAALKDDPYSLPLYCTCCGNFQQPQHPQFSPQNQQIHESSQFEHKPASTFSGNDQPPKPHHTTPIPPQRTLIPYYMHNHVVAQLLPFVTSGHLSHNTTTLPDHLNCPVLQLFVEAYTTALIKLRTTLLQLIGAFNLDSSKILDLLIVVYLYTCYTNTSVNTFSAAILSPRFSSSHSLSSSQALSSPQQSIPQLDPAADQLDPTSTPFLAEQFPTDSILSLLTPISPLLGDHADPTLTYAAGHPALQLMTSPATLLFFGLISLFSRDVLLTTIGTQLTLYSGSSNPMLAESTCSSTMPEFISPSTTTLTQLNPTATPSTQSHHDILPTQSIWIPVVYLAGLLVHYNTITYQSLSLYIDPLSVSLTTLSQKSYSITSVVKDAIKSLLVTRLTDSDDNAMKDPISALPDPQQHPTLLAQLEAIGGFDPAGYLTSPGHIGAHLPQSLQDRTTEPVLILFSTLFSIDAYFYILRMYQAFTAAHRTRNDYLSATGPYLSLDQCRAFAMSRVVYFVAPYQINFDSYVRGIIPYQGGDDANALLPLRRDGESSSSSTVSWPFISLYNDNRDQLLRMMGPSPLNGGNGAEGESSNNDNNPDLLDDDDALMMMLMGGSSSSALQTKPETLTHDLPFYPFLSFTPFESSNTAAVSTELTCSSSHLTIQSRTPANHHESLTSTAALPKFSHLDLLYLQFSQCGDLVLLFNNEAIERSLVSPNPLSAYLTPHSPIPKLSSIIHQTQIQAMTVPHRFLMPQTYRASHTSTITSNHYFNALVSRLHAFMFALKPLIGTLQTFYVKPSISTSPLPSLSLSTIKLIIQHLLCLTSPIRGYIATSLSLFEAICTCISLLLFHVKTLLQIQSKLLTAVANEMSLDPAITATATTTTTTTTTTETTQPLHQIPHMSLKRRLTIGSPLYPCPLSLTVPIVNRSTNDDDCENSGSQLSPMSTLYEFFTLLSHVIFPAHSLLPGSSSNNNALWSILSHLNYSDRYALYTLQQSHQKTGYMYSTLAEQFVYTQYISRTKYCRKRLANDKVQETSALGSKFLLPAPLISLDLLIDSFKTMSNLAQPLIELCANQSPLLHDIFTYLLTSNIVSAFDSTYNHQASYPLTMETSMLEKFVSLYANLQINYPASIDLTPLIHTLTLFAPHGKLTTSTALTHTLQVLSNITADEDFQLDKIKFSTSSFFLAYQSQPATFTFENVSTNTKLLSSLFSTLNLPQLYQTQRSGLTIYPNVSKLPSFTTPLLIDRCAAYGFTADPIPSTPAPGSTSHSQPQSLAATKFIGPADPKIPPKSLAVHIHQSPSHALHFSPRVLLHFNAIAAACTFSTPNASLPQSHLSLSTSPLHPLIRYQHQTHPWLLELVPFYGSSIIFPPQALSLVQAFTPTIYSVLLSMLSIYHNMVNTASNIEDYVQLSTLLDKTMNNITVLRQFMSYYCDFTTILKSINPVTKAAMVQSVYDIYLGFKIDSLSSILHLYRSIMYRYPEVLDYTLNTHTSANSGAPGTKPSISKQQCTFLQTIHRGEPKAVLTQHAPLIQSIPQPFIHFIDLMYHNYLFYKDADLLEQVHIHTNVDPNPEIQADPDSTDLTSLYPTRCPPIAPISTHLVHFFAFFWYFHTQHIHHEILPTTQPNSPLPPPPQQTASSTHAAGKPANASATSNTNVLNKKRIQVSPEAKSVSTTVLSLYQPLLKTLSHKRNQVYAPLNDPKHSTSKQLNEFQCQILDYQIIECYHQIQYQQFLFQQHRHLFNTISILPFPQRIPTSITLPDDIPHTIATPAQFHQLPVQTQAQIVNLPHNITIMRLFTILFIQTAIIPRILLTSVDAYYSAHFVHSMRKSTCIGFNFQLFTQLFTDELELLMLRCTKNEAQRLGVFINELFYFVPSISPIPSALPTAPLTNTSESTTTIALAEFRDNVSGWVDLHPPTSLASETFIVHPTLQATPAPSPGLTQPTTEQLSRSIYSVYERITRLLTNSISQLLQTVPANLSLPGGKRPLHPALTTKQTDMNTREIKEKLVITIVTMIGKLQIFPHFQSLGDQLVEALETIVSLYDVRSPHADYLLGRSSSSTMYSTLNNIKNMYSAQQRTKQWSEYLPYNNAKALAMKEKLKMKSATAMPAAAGSVSTTTATTTTTAIAPGAKSTPATITGSIKPPTSTSSKTASTLTAVRQTKSTITAPGVTTPSAGVMATSTTTKGSGEVQGGTKRPLPPLTAKSVPTTTTTSTDATISAPASFVRPNGPKRK